MNKGLGSFEGRRSRLSFLIGGVQCDRLYNVNTSKLNFNSQLLDQWKQ
ncbi:MAG: hypothetical protein J7647_25355 [Cyanobacteria bacterium SBLK]|nr:hypothetical protein [Cyanobacteria bacterium SBLK]